MIRLVLMLSVSLFAVFLIAGADNGQKRLGLQESSAALPRLARLSQPEEEIIAASSQPQNVALRSTADAANEAQVNQAVLQPASLEPAAAATTPAVAQPRIGDLKYVEGRSVNVRSGPSTNEAVVGRLTRGEAVSVLWIEDNGWARVRVEGDGIDGFMSMDFLSDTAP